MSPSDQGPRERPDYKVYRSRPRLSDRFRRPDLSGLRRKREGRRGTGRGSRMSSLGGDRRRWLRWLGIGALAWLAISIIAFAISAQIQKSKLDDDVGAVLSGNPFLLIDPQTILLLGGDQRTGKIGRLGRGREGQGSPRADTIMLVRAGGGAFRKLSIPRDSLAAIPGYGETKINAAFAIDDPNQNGNAALMTETVEDFLDIEVDQVAIVDFEGFVDLINALGGIRVDLPSKVCGKLDGGREQGGQTLNYGKGKHTVNGGRALALSRLRKNDCDPTEDDLARARRQQIVLNGIKGRLTNPLRLPYNFIKGPFIAWSAPKAIVSSMGSVTMPQLALSTVVGGGNEDVLEPSAFGPGGTLVISEQERRRARNKLLGRN